MCNSSILNRALSNNVSNLRALYIDGGWIAPVSDAVLQVTNAATEMLFTEIAEATAPDVERAVSSARLAFDYGPWPTMTHADRAKYLRAIADAIRERSDDLAAIWTIETGILASASQNLSKQSADVFDYYADLGSTFPFVERHEPSSGVGVGLLVREPVGVVAAIMPWNSPLSMIASKIAPALISGCTVVIKASPEAPVAAYVFADIIDAIGMPPGIVNVIAAESDASEALVRNPKVDKVTFTGSTVVGRRIGAICADRVARVSLELGGKSAAIILDDYDLDSSAQSLAASTRILSGQVCASLSRIIVSRHRHDQFVEAFSSAMSATRVGDPFDPATEMGPLATSRQRDVVESFIARGISEGGAILTSGGKRPRNLDSGYYIEPTVFANVENASTIAREEIFGPVVSVIAAGDENEAINIANDSIYGLNASVFTDDADRAFRVARRLRTGTVSQNGFRTDFGIAFGGFKQSGVGREGGQEGLYPYLESKTILLH